jgi:EmrB/QacA subfamily drug resistance transporter
MPSAAPRRPVLALAAICLAALMFGLEISSVPIVLPVLKARLQAGFQDLQWIMNAYTIACTTVLMVTGTLADRYGRRRVFMLSVLAFGLASLLCGLAPGTQVLIGARFLQGMAGGAMFICSIAILSHEFPEGRARGRAFAVWGVVAGIGLGFGPVAGSSIVALASWHWVFLVHAPLALLGLAWIRAGIAESRDPQAGQQRLDLAGLVTLTLAVLGFTSLITQGDSLGWRGPLALGLAAVSALSLAAFVIVERRHPHPMFDFSVFRIRDFSGAIVGCIGMNCSYWPFMIYLPLYFSAGLHYDTATAGLALLVYTVPFLVMPPIAQWLLLRYQARFVIPAGLFLIGLGFALMKLGSGWVHAAGGWAVLPGALLAGVGLGLTTTPATNMTTGSVPARRAGMASGMDVSARLITLALNIALMGAVLVAGIAAALHDRLGAVQDEGLLQAVAEQLAGGDAAGAQQALATLGPDQSAGLLQDAVAQGFGWVMLYGALGAWLSAALSLAVFGGRRGEAAQGVSGGVARGP